MKRKDINKVFITRILTVCIAVTLFAGCGADRLKQQVEENVASTDISGEASASEVIEDTTLHEYVVNGVDFTASPAYVSGAYSETNSNVFYEIFVGSFSDSDGDGTGDLRGIIGRFDYLNDGNPESGTSLGIEGIWLSPIFKSPSYHKYDVTNYYEIDPKFGTMDDLKELVSLAHSRGVKVILDMVINHTSSDNKWFQDFKQAHRAGNTDSPYYDYYTYSSSNAMGGRTFYKITETDEYYEGNFSGDMPELNFDNEEVRNNMIDIARYYLADIGVDGFRFDAAKYIYYGEQEKNVEFWLWYMDELKSIKPDVYTVAEVWDSDSMTDRYAVALNCFDFTMSQAEGLISSTAQKGDVNGYVSYVEKYINKVREVNDDATIIPFIANHDMDRAAGYLNMTSGNGKMAANIYLLGPGSPFIYYGEEIGMKGSRGGANTDANRRLAMRWGDDDKVRNPEGSTFEDSKQTNPTLAEQLTDETSLYNHYKTLIMLRKANPEIYLGKYKALKFEGSKAGGFVGTYNDTSVVVIHNTLDLVQTVNLYESGLDTSTVSGLKVTYAIGSGLDFDNPVGASLQDGILTISPQTSVILR